LWQQRDPKERLFDYGGKNPVKPDGRASLQDLLFKQAANQLGIEDTFGEEVVVADLMSTETGMLCYRY
jgi:hypothetical protein